MQRVISFLWDGGDLAGIRLSSKANKVYLQPGFWQPRTLLLPVKEDMLR